MDNFQHAAEIVRMSDRDRYLADLFAPEESRPHLFALHAFNAEVARVRDIVSDPRLGEIRLQFWRDALRSDGAGHPVGQALTATIATFDLPLKAFDDLLEARTFDLYDDPMPDLNALEGYAGETSSRLFQLAAMILAGGGDPGTADLSGHAGVAYALTGLMRAFPLHARRGQLFIPANLLAGYGLDRAQALAGEPPLSSALADLRAIARGHLEKARDLAETLDPKLLPAFLPMALVDGDLKRLAKQDDEPLAPRPPPGGLGRQWTLWKAARRRAF